MIVCYWNWRQWELGFCWSKGIKGVLPPTVWIKLGPLTVEVGD